MVNIKPEPDFTRLRKVLLRQGELERVPFYEFFVDVEIMEAVINKPFTKLDLTKKDEKEQYLKWLIEFYYRTGYDYVPMWSWGGFFALYDLRDQDTASLPRTVRIWRDEHRGTIMTRKDFETYPWPAPEDGIDLSGLEFVSKNLPDGMKMIINGPGGVLGNVKALMGYEPMAYALYDDPQLVQDMFNKVGEKIVEVIDIICQIDNVGAIAIGNDLGFKTQTMFSPEVLRKYAFPWEKKVVETVHKHNLPFILHSCGNLEAIIDDLIDYVGIDAKHSYEDVIMPVTEAKKKYGNRVAILGGVDVDKLSRLPEDELRRYVRNILEECAPGGGYALGSGNSIANYIKVENYLAMLDEGIKYRRYS